MFAFAFYVIFAFSSKPRKHLVGNRDSFSFVTSNNKQYSLSAADFYAKPKNGISTFLTKSLSAKKSAFNSKRWFYVHVLNNRVKEAQKYVKIDISDEIIKDTFVLYLSDDQVESLSDFCLFKKIESSDKINDVSLLNETDYLYVKTASDYELSSTNEYQIDQKVDSNSYIIQISQKVDNDDHFLQKKLKVIEKLSKIEAVQSISVYNKPKSENYVNVGNMQKYHQPLQRRGYLNLFEYGRYVHDHNITGEGQILTLVDTLLDFRHPMFSDEKVPIEFNKEMKEHRKIIYYNYSRGDINAWKTEITESNHGTHVAGTLAGKTVKNIGNESINEMFDGSAPGAKILYAGEYGNTTASQIEEIMKKYGSHISSNSWGDYDLYVDSLNYEYGSLAYRNDQSLFVFAAGNHGQGDIGYTVCDPGGSKNVLTVSYAENPVYPGTNFYTLHTPNNPDFILDLYTEFMRNLFETSDFLGVKKGDSNIIAIDSRLNDTESIQQACYNVNGSHVTIIYGNSIDDGILLLTNCKEGYDTNGIVMTENISVIENLIQSKEKVAILYDVIIDQPNPIVRGHLGSIGPGNKGIMKPDVTAPGNLVLSASSSAGDVSEICEDYIHCGISMKSGSSMATPNVAGAAALISQYFKSGKWGDSVDLDGCTLRALIINSCFHPNESHLPDLIFGHGYVDLSTVLPLDGEFGVQITPQDNKPRVKENGHVAAKVHVNSDSKPLQFTMSYLDPMLHENSPIPLSRDLDFYVVSPTGTVIHGDHLDKDTQHLSTNEKIIIEDLSVYEGDYTIHVYAGNFIDSSLSDETKYQEFSVVVTGDVDNKYIQFEESTQSPCKKSDPDYPDRCYCSATYMGPACKTIVNSVVNKTSFYAKLKAMNIVRVKFTLEKNISSVMAYYTGSKEMPTIWVSPTCHLSLGDYEVNGKVGVGNQAETVLPFETNEICVAVFNNYFRDDAFYHIEVFPKNDDGGDSGGDGGDSDDDDGDKNHKSNNKFYIGFAVMGIIIAALVVVVIVLIVKLRKNNADYIRSADSNARATPLLQNF